MKNGLHGYGDSFNTNSLDINQYILIGLTAVKAN